MKIQDAADISLQRCELHACMRQIMRLCRWLGFFPVEGMDSPLANRLRFSVKSAYGAYFVVTMIQQAVLTGCYLYTFVTTKLSLSSASNVLFYANSLMSGLLLLQLARHWPSLVLKVKEIEQSITEIHISRNMGRKLKAVAFTLLSLALIEHILSIVHQFHVVKACASSRDMLWQTLYKLRMPYALQPYWPATIWTAIFYEAVNIQATFLWTFMDVMIICISMYLTEYFNELNNLIADQKHVKTAAVWERLRTTHCSLVTLVNLMNCMLSCNVLLTFFTDLFFICQQLFNILSYTDYGTLAKLCAVQETPRALRHIYFVFSFLFLVTRVSTLSVMAANVNTVAHKPRMALGEIPTSMYNIGSQRFLRQINYTTIGISGWFFYVTRRMILIVAGTIVTYELVLLQLK